VRNQADIGGGGLLDIGCYPITVSRFVFGAEPQRVFGLFDRDPKFKTDRTASGLADFGNGRQLSFTVSTQAAGHQRATIVGTKGRIEIEIPFNAPPDRPNRYFLQNARAPAGKWVELPVSDQYQLQAEAFGRAIRGKAGLVWGVADAVQNMRIIDAYFRSERSGRWEKP
jgi:predicted dehydrogenase